MIKYIYFIQKASGFKKNFLKLTTFNKKKIKKLKKSPILQFVSIYNFRFLLFLDPAAAPLRAP